MNLKISNTKTQNQSLIIYELVIISCIGELLKIFFIKVLKYLQKNLIYTSNYLRRTMLDGADSSTNTSSSDSSSTKISSSSSALFLFKAGN